MKSKSNNFSYENVSKFILFVVFRFHKRTIFVDMIVSKNVISRTDYFVTFLFLSLRFYKVSKKLWFDFKTFQTDSCVILQLYFTPNFDFSSLIQNFVLLCLLYNPLLQIYTQVVAGFIHIFIQVMCIKCTRFSVAYKIIFSIPFNNCIIHSCDLYSTNQFVLDRKFP